MSGVALRRILSAILITAVPFSAAAQEGGSRWALPAADCNGEASAREQAPLLIERMSLRWFDTDCRVISSYKVGETLFLQARCVGATATGTIPVMLEPSGENLRVGWNREPIRVLQRCQWTAELGWSIAAAGHLQPAKAPGSR